ncbi:MAG: ROK family transcriptional regulator, partial [Bacillota bacterium]
MARVGNRLAILRLLVQRGPVSRTDIGSVTGLTSGAVSRITAGLIGEGLLREIGSARQPARAHVGRAPALLDLDEKLAVIGVHIQPDAISAVLVSPKGRVLERERVAVSAPLLPEAAVEHAAAIVEGLLDRARRGHHAPPVATGIGVPGIVDAALGHVRYSAVLGWKNVSIQRLLQERISSIPVTVTHNVSSMALAAHWFGPAEVRAAEDLLLV